MKTITQLNEIAAKINAAAKVEYQAGLLPTQWIAHVCDDNGSPISGEPVGEVYVAIDMHHWHDKGRGMTQKGRDEIARENQAYGRVKELAESLGDMEPDGSGDGEWGSFECYRLT